MYKLTIDFKDKRVFETIPEVIEFTNKIIKEYHVRQLSIPHFKLEDVLKNTVINNGF